MSNLIMKEDYVPYSYQKVVLWILGVFVITAIIPPLVAPLRYTEFKWLYTTGMWIGYLSVIFVNVAVIINSFYTLIEFRETKKYNWFWFFLGLLPIVYYIFLFGAAFVNSPD